MSRTAVKLTEKGAEIAPTAILASLMALRQNLLSQPI